MSNLFQQLFTMHSFKSVRSRHWHVIQKIRTVKTLLFTHSFAVSAPILIPKQPVPSPPPLRILEDQFTSPCFCPWSSDHKSLTISLLHSHSHHDEGVDDDDDDDGCRGCRVTSVVGPATCSARRRCDGSLTAVKASVEKTSARRMLRWDTVWKDSVSRRETRGTR